MLLPGCLEAISSLREQFPEIRWVTGLPFTITNKGVPIPSYGSAGFSPHPTAHFREVIRRGLYAKLAYRQNIQQEGTFWEIGLWHKVGGLNTELALAFDFELWCKLAQHEELVQVVAPLAAFRRRPGQASGNLRGYHKEVKELWDQLRQESQEPVTQLRLNTAHLAFVDSATSRWKVVPFRPRFLASGRAGSRVKPAGGGQVRHRILRFLSQKGSGNRFFRLALNRVRDLRRQSP
jgi:hypothetical protein